MAGLGRMLIVLGVVLAGAGLVLTFLGPYLGRIPGDLEWRGRNTVVYFPLGTCLLLSVVVSLLFWLFGRR